MSSDDTRADVEQVDRDAATDMHDHIMRQMGKDAPAKHLCDQMSARMRAGCYDGDESVQAFARHRLQHSGKVAAGEAIEAAAQLIGDRIEATFPVTVLASWATQLARDLAALQPSPATADPQLAERTQIVGWLRQQSLLGANRGNAKPKRSTGRAAFGGGSLALSRAADAIESGEYLANDNATADPLPDEEARVLPSVEELARVINPLAWDDGLYAEPGGLGQVYNQDRARAEATAVLAFLAARASQGEE